MRGLWCGPGGPHSILVAREKESDLKGPRRILLTGGGTAGHVNPALAIGSALEGEGARFLYVGVRGRAEEIVVPRAGLAIRFVRASGYPGLRPSPRLARFAFDLATGTLQAAGILLRFRPHLIVGTGGYASAPVIFAAVLLRRLGLLRSRVFLHEQNAVPGKLNQLVGRAAHRVFLTFPESLAFFPRNGVVTGYPLRRRISPMSREEARAGLDFEVPDGRSVLFVFGGSQGARTLNRAVVDALRHLLPHRDRLFVVHGMGLKASSDYDAAADTEARLRETYSEDERRLLAGMYVARAYFHEIERVYALADLVVVRAGAGTLNELSALGLPAIVVPKANLPGDHQVVNARALSRAGAAEVLYEETVLDGEAIVERLDGALLAREILELVDDPGRRAAMAEKAGAFFGHEALETIRRTVEESVQGRDVPPPAPEALERAREALGEGALPGNRELLRRLERAAVVDPETVLPDAGDLEYATSRATSLLVADDWEDRNVGVKLLGLLHAREKLPLLVALLKDRRPAPLLERLLGGDLVQVGFVRRNTLQAIERIGEVDAGVEDVLLQGFTDPYWEVRAEAARCAGQFGCRLQRKGEHVAGLVSLLADRNFEVAAAAAEALGKLGTEAEAVPPLLALQGARMWKVRAAALRGLHTLVTRGAVTDREALARQLPAFPLVSTDFTPQFEIKAAYKKLREALR